MAEYDENQDENDSKDDKTPNIEEMHQLVADFEKAIKDEDWLSSSKDSWNRYRQQAVKGKKRIKGKKKFPLWFATTKVRQPLVFSKVPQPVVNPILPVKEGLIVEAASVTQKLAEVLQELFPFYSVACSSRDDFLLTQMGVARVMVDAEITEEPVKEYLTTQIIEQIDPQTGQPFQQQVLIDKEGEQVDPQLVRFDSEGEPYLDSLETVEKVEKERVFLKHVAYNEFMWDWEAREFSEWDYCGFHSALTKRQIIKRFGTEALKAIPPEKDGTTPHGRKKYKVRELWWKPSLQRLIFVDGGEEYLSVDENPLDLEQFFPIVYPMFDNLSTDMSIPFTEYSAVEDMLDTIDLLSTRKAECIQLGRVRGMYDTSVSELSSVISETDAGKFIGIADLAARSAQGSTYVQYLDVSPVTAANQQYEADLASELAKYDQVTGFSDIVRGVTNPYESATAQERKAQFSLHRLVFAQQDMQRWCRDNLKLMIDAALQYMSNERIFELVEPSLTDTQRQMFPDIMKKLKSDLWRSVSIDIETDSTILIDEDAEKAQATEMANTISSFFGSMAQTVETMPEIVDVSADIVQLVLSKYRMGKDFQGTIKQKIEEMAQAVQARKAQEQAQAAQGEAPSAVEQFEMQMAQMDAQLKQQKESAEIALKNRDLDRKEYEVMLKDANSKSDQQLEQQEFMLERAVKSFEMQMDQARVLIEDYKAQAQVAESRLEEARLAKDSQMNEFKMMIEAQRGQGPIEPQAPIVLNPPEMPPINVNVTTAKPGRKTGRIVYDELGNAQMIVEEEPSI